MGEEETKRSNALFVPWILRNTNVDDVAMSVRSVNQTIPLITNSLIEPGPLKKVGTRKFQQETTFFSNQGPNFADYCHFNQWEKWWNGVGIRPNKRLGELNQLKCLCSCSRSTYLKLCISRIHVLWWILCWIRRFFRRSSESFISNILICSIFESVCPP